VAQTDPDGWAAATIWLALTLSLLDSSIAYVALPTIAADLNAPAADSVWVVNAYQLAIVVSLLPMAAIGEMVGFRRVFQLGIIVFSLGSLGCTFAHSLPMLAFARAIQGFGAAGIMSQNGALVRFTYPSKMLGRGLGLNALVASAGAALGPTVAAGILAVASWQWLFAVNIPIGIGAYLLGRKSLPDNPKSGSFDLEGTLLSASMFGFGFIGVDPLTRSGSIWIGMSALALGAGSGIGLVLHSRSQSEPIVPFDLLRNPVFSLSVAPSIASFASQMLAFASLPFFFESVLHRSQVETGLLMTPWPLAVGIGAHRRAPRRQSVGGSVGSRRFGRPLRGSGPFGRSSRDPDCGGDCMAHGPVRSGIRLFPGTEQPLDALGCASRAERGGRRHARHRASHGADRRRYSRRDLVPDRGPFRDDSARHGGSVGSHRGGSQRG
jgi:MFS family permease